MTTRERERLRNLRRPSAEARGYGIVHRELRKQVAPSVAAGLARCARCGKPISPGEPWDLGHDDENRSRYVGPEHRACNRATQSRRRVQSRQW